MDLIYSMRRKPLKCEPPHFESTTDPEVIRPICTISTCNIIAFSSLTELQDGDGDTWGGHVYVCDLDAPWDSYRVTGTVHPISALEWDEEGKQLLVATTVGEMFVYGQKDYLLNEWTCLYSANFPGEHIIAAIFFHNGRRIAVMDKKHDVPIADRFQALRAAPTMKGFGGVASEGVCLVTGTGAVCAVSADGQRAARPVRAPRRHVAAAHLAHRNGSLLVACGGRGGVRCAAVSLARGPPLALTLTPLPTLHLTADDGSSAPRCVRWWARDEAEWLLVCGAALSLWKLAERAHPVHKLLAKGPVQGSTTPGGGPKPGTDCFNTVVWQKIRVWPYEGGAGGGQVAVARAPLAPPHLLLTDPAAIHLLDFRDSHHFICSRTIATSAEAGAATPPKKPKYGQGNLSGSGGWVCGVSLSPGGSAAAAIDTHSQLHVFRLPHPAPDIPTPLAAQQTAAVLEYALVSGLDCLDLLLTLSLKPSLAEAVLERITESFQRQPPAFQQYYYLTWLKLRIALCSVCPNQTVAASNLSSVQGAWAVWAGASAGVREDRPDCALAALAALAAADDPPAHHTQEHEKNLQALEAKADSSEGTGLHAVTLQALAALRRPLQLALDTAVTALAAFAHAQHSPHHAHGYELYSDLTAINLLRKLVVVARVSGRGGEALSRPLARLAAPGPHKPDLIEECVSLCAAWGARVWEARPRCCVAAPPAATPAAAAPLYFEYGVEPEYLRYAPEPPPYAQSDNTPALEMDSVRYMYLGGGRRPARWRRCVRCGARALPAACPARHPLQRAYDARFLPACRCGGKWTLFSNV